MVAMTVALGCNAVPEPVAVETGVADTMTDVPFALITIVGMLSDEERIGDVKLEVMIAMLEIVELGFLLVLPPDPKVVADALE
jgi:hypothetical protein